MCLGALPAEAFGTIETIETFNNLFDILNLFELKNLSKFKKVFDGSQYQRDFLNITMKLSLKYLIY